MLTPPADVTDLMLWRLAVTVADHHRSDIHGRCAHPICAHAAWPCPPLQLARRADQAARRPATITARASVAAATASIRTSTGTYARRTPSWVALLGATTAPPQPGTDAATVLALLQPAPATTENIADRARLPAGRVAQLLQDLHSHGLAAPLTQALDRR
jgi:hypothetical protein